MQKFRLSLEVNDKYAGSVTVEIDPAAFKGDSNTSTETHNGNCVDNEWQKIGSDFGFPETENFCDIVKHLDNNLQGRFQELAKRVVYAKNMNSETCQSTYETEWENLLNEANQHPDGVEHYMQGFLHGFVEMRFGNGMDVQSCYDNVQTQTEEK